MLSLSLGVLPLIALCVCGVVSLVLAIVGVPLAILFHLVLPTAALLYGLFLLIRGLARRPFAWSELVPGAVVLAIWYILWH